MKHPLVLLGCTLALLTGAGIANAVGDKVQVILIVRNYEDTCEMTNTCFHYCALDDSACVTAISHCRVTEYNAVGWPTCAVYFALAYRGNVMFKVSTP